QGLVCRLRAGLLWRCGIALNSREIHFGNLPRTLARSEVSIVPLKTRHVGPDAVGKLSNISVVILKSIVIALTFYSNSVFCSCKLVLQSQEILIGTKLRIILYHHQKASERTIQLLVGGNLL